MKRLSLIMLFLIAMLLSAGSNAEIKQMIAGIQAKPNEYYYGYAEGKQRKETDQEALEALMSSIYVVVSSEIKSSTTEDSDTLRQVLQTYTFGRLPDVQMLSYKEGPVFHILRYIAKDNYQKIFESKRSEVEGFLHEAEENLASNQFGKVFRNYYRAAISLEALPENSILYNRKTYTPKIVFDRIRELAKDIEIKVESNEYKDDTRYIVLDFSYKGNPVQDLNLYYYDNHGYIPKKTNTNLVELELYGKEYEKMNKLSLKIDLKEDLYSCYSDETDALSKLFRHENLEEYRELPLKKEIKIPQPKNQQESNVTFDNKADCPVLGEFTRNVNKLFLMLNNEDIDDESIFTDKSIIKRMNQVISCNHTKLLSYPQKAQINKTTTGWEARQLGVSVSCEGFPSRNETVVIDFDDTGKIYNFCYTINPALHKLFESEGIAAGNWDYRQIAIKFLENYKTSYNTKNIEDIETLYSED
ncbi:MAG: LPP20 family lipoprotein, partial [Candidatus Cloacimonetes bacterium]|nr:LPP20 family lipoprotein [Candidatus Cloacimonadota bacterium]